MVTSPHWNRSSEVRRSGPAIAAASGATIALLMAAVSPAVAADDFWVAPSGGSFNDNGNWSLSAPPGSGDRAVFNTNLTGTIDFPVAGVVNNQGLDLRDNTSGVVTLNLNGSTYLLNSTTPLRVGQTASSSSKLVISDGAVRGSTDTSPLGGVVFIGSAGASGNELELSGGASMLGGASAFFIGQAATPGNNNILRVTGPGTSFSTTGTGATIIGAASATLGAASGNGNALIISDQANYTSINFHYIGGTGDGTPGPSNLMEIDNATFMNTNANRGIVVRDGTLRIRNDAFVQPGTVNMHEAGADAVLDFRDGTLNLQRWRLKGTETMTIGDGIGATATYRMPSNTAYVGLTGSGATVNTIEPSSAITLLLNTDARLEGRGTIGGSVSALGPGATATMDVDAPEGRELLTVFGDWNNANIALTLKLGDFPTELAEDTAAAQPFNAPHDALAVNGLFTHGSDVTVDLQFYVAPEDQDYDLQLIQWGSVAGIAPTVNFVNGNELEHEWRSDGLWVTAAVPEPGTVSVLALAACGMLMRRRARAD